MSNAIVPFEEATRLAKAFADSGFFQDARDVAKAMVKVQAGRELGLPPFASMTGIHIIKGKPVIGANVIATLVKNDPRYDYRIKENSDTACLLEWYEAGQLVGSAGFTMDEAKRAGLAGKDNWKNYPSDMLFARAISRGARRFAPGIFGGAPVYTPDEMGADVDEDGFIDVTPEPISENGFVKEPGPLPRVDVDEDGEIVIEVDDDANADYLTATNYNDFRERYAAAVPYYNHAKHVGTVLYQDGQVTQLNFTVDGIPAYVAILEAHVDAKATE